MEQRAIHDALADLRKEIPTFQMDFQPPMILCHPEKESGENTFIPFNYSPFQAFNAREAGGEDFSKFDLRRLIPIYLIGSIVRFFRGPTSPLQRPGAPGIIPQPNRNPSSP